MDFKRESKIENIPPVGASMGRMRAALCLLSAFCVYPLSAADSWNVAGSITGILEDRNSIVLQHQGIPGYAPEAGSLEVRVEEGDYATARKGRSIRGKLVPGEDGLFLKDLWPADKEDEKTMTLINRDLTRPRIGAPKGRLNTGDEFPRFALYNQMGELVIPAALDQKVLVVNFVFTRSKVPTMSAATVQRTADLQDRLAEAGLLDSVRLLSLTVDPDYDTPGICYSFLDAYGVDHETYWMLTGSKKTLDFVTEKIGLVAAPSEKTIINHSMLVLIIDREGKIFHRIPGVRWNLDDVYNRLEILLNG